MTSITMVENRSAVDAHWGERRVRERTARRYRRAQWIIGSAVLLALGVPFVEGLVDGFAGREVLGRADERYQVATAAAFTLLAGWLAWRNWRETDEVQRRTALNTWAAMGMASLALHPLVRAAQPLLHLGDPWQVAWIAAIGVGLIVMAWQKVRG